MYKQLTIIQKLFSTFYGLLAFIVSYLEWGNIAISLLFLHTAMIFSILIYLSR